MLGEIINNVCHTQHRSLQENNRDESDESEFLETYCNAAADTFSADYLQAFQSSQISL